MREDRQDCFSAGPVVGGHWSDHVSGDGADGWPGSDFRNSDGRDGRSGSKRDGYGDKSGVGCDHDASLFLRRTVQHQSAYSRHLYGDGDGAKFPDIQATESGGRRAEGDRPEHCANAGEHERDDYGHGSAACPGDDECHPRRGHGERDLPEPAPADERTAARSDGVRNPIARCSERSTCTDHWGNGQLHRRGVCRRYSNDDGESARGQPCCLKLHSCGGGGSVPGADECSGRGVSGRGRAELHD